MPIPPPAAIAAITNMGFSREQAIDALHRTSNLEAAIDYILKGGAPVTEPEVRQEPAPKKAEKKPNLKEKAKQPPPPKKEPKPTVMEPEKPPKVKEFIPADSVSDSNALIWVTNLSDSMSELEVQIQLLRNVNIFFVGEHLIWRFW